MSCITSTPCGRIFCGGRDGHLYEISYSKGAGWREKRCTKVCVTGGLGLLVPSVFKLWPSDPAKVAIAQIVVDAKRHIMYTRSKDSCITVYDLGSDGQQPPRRVAEFRQPTTAARNKEVTQLVHIAVVSPSESASLHLVAVCNNGRRMYFSTSSTNYNSMYRAASVMQRPSGLSLCVSRAPPSQPSGAQPGALGYQTLVPPQRPLQVDKAYYSDGLLLLSDVRDRDPNANLVLLGLLRVPTFDSIASNIAPTLDRMSQRKLRWKQLGSDL
eukprot:2528023-Pyramimonas_sp.AAC.1